MGGRKFTTALDAYAKLTKFTFTGSNSTALFSTRFVHSDSYTRSVAANDIVPYMMLGSTDPPFNPFQIIQSMLNGADNMNVNVFNYGDGNGGDGYVLTNDFWNIYHIDAKSLDTIGPVKPNVPGAPKYDQQIVIGCAHSLPENGTDNHITFVSLASAIPGLKSMYFLYRATDVHTREQIAEITVDSISYMHSFGLTQNHVILIAHPFFIDPTKIFRTFKAADGFVWNPNKSTKFYITDLKTGFVKTVATENFFFLHQINSFEDELGNIVVDICTYKNGDAMNIMDMKTLRNATGRAMFRKPTIKRYTIDPVHENVDVTTFQDSVKYASNLDFPTINENYRYRKYCYVYGVVYTYNTTDFLDMALVKKDLCTGKRDAVWYKPGSYFNEAWFEARPGATEEDDGVLLVDVIDSLTGASQMVVFDAGTLTIATAANLPTNNPFGTHGRFFKGVY